MRARHGLCPPEVLAHLVELLAAREWGEPVMIGQAFGLVRMSPRDYDARFAKPPANAKDLHRSMAPRDRLEDAFSWQVERTLSQSLTLQCDKVLFILDPTEAAQAAIGKRVTVADYPDGRLVISYQGSPLSYRTFDKIRKVNQAAVVENKRLGPLLEMIKLYQDAHPLGRGDLVSRPRRSAYR